MAMTKHEKVVRILKKAHFGSHIGYLSVAAFEMHGLYSVFAGSLCVVVLLLSMFEHTLEA